MTTDEAAAATNYDFFRFHLASRSNEAGILTTKNLLASTNDPLSHNRNLADIVRLQPSAKLQNYSMPDGAGQSSQSRTR
jgi:hypothetical protein